MPDFDRQPDETAERRRAYLRHSDSELRLEGKTRNPGTAHFFEAWAQGTMTDDELLDALKRFYTQPEASEATHDCKNTD